MRDRIGVWVLNRLATLLLSPTYRRRMRNIVLDAFVAKGLTRPRGRSPFVRPDVLEGSEDEQ